MCILFQGFTFSFHLLPFAFTLENTVQYAFSRTPCWTVFSLARDF
jgi:hypothetical protein